MQFTEIIQGSKQGMGISFGVWHWETGSRSFGLCGLWFGASAISVCFCLSSKSLIGSLKVWLGIFFFWFLEQKLSNQEMTGVFFQDRQTNSPPHYSTFNVVVTHQIRPSDTKSYLSIFPSISKEHFLYGLGNKQRLILCPVSSVCRSFSCLRSLPSSLGCDL